MNYNEYNQTISLPDGLYEKTLCGVKSAVSKHNQVNKRRKTVFLSSAACFAVLLCSFTAVKYFGRNSSSNALESTINMPAENPNNESSIIIEAENRKYPYKIIIGDKIYSQYYFGDPKGGKDNNIELKKSEIGELICEIDYFNLSDNLETFEPMTIKDAKNNNFYKARAYRYAKAESDNIIIVQAKDGYNLFYLNGLKKEYTIGELLNIYTANGDNEIAEIEIWQDEIYSYTAEMPDEKDSFTGKDIRPLFKGSVKDKNAVNSILSILKERSDYSGKDYSGEYDKALSKYFGSGLIEDCPLMSEYGAYKLRIIFADGSELIPDKFSLDLIMQKDYFYFCICRKGNTIYYSLDNSDYDKLVYLINESL